MDVNNSKITQAEDAPGTGNHLSPTGVSEKMVGEKKLC